MKTAFIIHWTGGNPGENWFPWMKQELEVKGYQVFVPTLPTPDNQSLTSWKDAFDQYLQYINKDTIFIAHSSGPAFVLSILENIKQPISACYFVAGFLGLIGIESFDRLNKTITHREFHWGKIKESSQSFYMYHWSDDPYVPLNNAQDMADSLWIQIDMIEWGGHLNSESGYKSFEYLWEKIQ